MRELRQDISYNLDSPKEELDQIDETRIEEVLMGLKGLKPEEIFSFLGKNNLTTAETEISSVGLGTCDQSSLIDPIESEHLQSSSNANNDRNQINGQTVASHSFNIPKIIHSDRVRSRVEADSFRQITNEYPRNIYSDSNSTELNDIQLLERFKFSSKYRQDFSMSDFPVEDLREEEIVATNIAEEMICTSNVDEKDDIRINNTYVIENSVDGLEVEDKPKPIKLLIKRVDSEDESNEVPVARSKSKRTRQPSVRLEEISPICKRRRLKKVTSRLEKNRNHSNLDQKADDSVEDCEFSFVNTVHQDDDYVYPSLDLSDDEGDDVYNFIQGDDETWTPKIKIKSSNMKTIRPTRDRKQNSAVAKCLEAAALKRAKQLSDSVESNEYSRKLSKKKCSVKTGKSANDSIHTGGNEDHSLTITTSKNRLSHTCPLPSTSTCSNDDEYNPSRSSAESSSASDLSESAPSSERKTLQCNNKIRRIKKVKQIIPPKINKLLQTPSHGKQSNISLQIAHTKKSVQHNLSISSSCISNSEKKSCSSAYVTKRGKPKKGMATAKQRLGKILKMHKMFF